MISLAVLALIVAACGQGAAINRADAITALSTTGLTPVEATCVADALNLVGELDAADPRIERGAAERDALVSATNFCVGNEPDTQVAGTQLDVDGGSTSFERAETDEEFALNASADGGVQLTDPEEIRLAGIEALVALGRGTVNATCVVDHILLSNAEVVLSDPNFGLGLHPIEADAFAACIGVN